MQCLPTNLNFWQQKQFTFTIHLFLKFLHQGNKLSNVLFIHLDLHPVHGF